MAEASPEVKSAGGGVPCSPPEGRSPRNGGNGGGGGGGVVVVVVNDNPSDSNISVGGGALTGSSLVAVPGETLRSVTTSAGTSSSATTPSAMGFGGSAPTTAAGALGCVAVDGGGGNAFIGGGATAAVVVVVTKDKDNAKSSGNSSPCSPKHLRRLRIKLTEQQLESVTRDELAAKWRDQDLYVECLEAQVAAQEGELACLRESEEKYRQQCCEISHRERILVRRLASKEQQLLGYINQLTEMRAVQTPSASALRSALLDPAVNILIKKLRQELLSTKAKLEDTQNELSAWKFTPDSNTGKRLMAKCRLLYQENEDLGRMIASGRIAKLEGELALQKSFSEEVKKSQSELDEFLQDLDEDVEGMQSTIYFLQQELRKARESVSLLQQENSVFKSASASVSTLTSHSCPGLLPQPPQPTHTPPPPPPPQLVLPPPPPPPGDNNLANGLSLPHAVSIKKEESSNDVSEDVAALVAGNQIDAMALDYRSVDTTGRMPPLAAPLPPPLSRSSLSPSSISGATVVEAFKDAESHSPMRIHRRPDEPDESSNDSAALIIKVENEELSDREEEEEEKKEKAVAAGPPAPTPTPTPTPKPAATPTPTPTLLVIDSCETRRPQRLSMRTKDKSSTTTTTKNESVVGKSNGDERNTSRTSTRRLLRDRTAKRDKSAADSDDERRQHKKKRRESILSIDYNEAEDDALLITNGENIQSDPED